MSEVVMADGHFQSIDFTTQTDLGLHRFTQITLKMMAHGTIMFPPGNMQRVRVVFSDEDSDEEVPTPKRRKTKVVKQETVLPRRIIR
jgi:hypothetical protein